MGGQIISDGGLTCPGDFAKAFGAGADFCMAGGMFAGHDESGGEVVERNGEKFKQFYGMSSKAAMEKHSGGVAEYRASEGKVVEVAYRGPVSATILQILGGVRSACTYVGASKLKELSKRTTFVRCTQVVNQVRSLRTPLRKWTDNGLTALALETLTGLWQEQRCGTERQRLMRASDRRPKSN